MEDTKYVRREDALPVTFTLDRDAADLLRTYCPRGTKSSGRFVSRLIFEHRAREEERARLRAEMAAVMKEE